MSKRTKPKRAIGIEEKGDRKKNAANGIEATDTKSQCLKHLKIVSLPHIRLFTTHRHRHTHTHLYINAMQERAKKTHTATTTIDQLEDSNLNVNNTYKHTHTDTHLNTRRKFHYLIANTTMGQIVY